MRSYIDTTNPVESLNASLCKLLHECGSFPNDESIIKLPYLALTSFEQKWERSTWDWNSVLGQLSIIFEGRIQYL